MREVGAASSHGLVCLRLEDGANALRLNAREVRTCSALCCLVQHPLALLAARAHPWITRNIQAQRPRMTRVTKMIEAVMVASAPSGFEVRMS